MVRLQIKLTLSQSLEIGSVEASACCHPDLHVCEKLLTNVLGMTIEVLVATRRLELFGNGESLPRSKRNSWSRLVSDSWASNPLPMKQIHCGVKQAGVALGGLEDRGSFVADVIVAQPSDSKDHWRARRAVDESKGSKHSVIAAKLRRKRSRAIAKTDEKRRPR